MYSSQYELSGTMADIEDKALTDEATLDGEPHKKDTGPYCTSERRWAYAMVLNISGIAILFAWKYALGPYSIFIEGTSDSAHYILLHGWIWVCIVVGFPMLLLQRFYSIMAHRESEDFEDESLATLMCRVVAGKDAIMGKAHSPPGLTHSFYFFMAAQLGDQWRLPTDHFGGIMWRYLGEVVWIFAFILLYIAQVFLVMDIIASVREEINMPALQARQHKRWQGFLDVISPAIYLTLCGGALGTWAGTHLSFANWSENDALSQIGYLIATFSWVLAFILAVLVFFPMLYEAFTPPKFPVFTDATSALLALAPAMLICGSIDYHGEYGVSLSNAVHWFASLTEFNVTKFFLVHLLYSTLNLKYLILLLLAPCECCLLTGVHYTAKNCNFTLGAAFYAMASVLYATMSVVFFDTTFRMCTKLVAIVGLAVATLSWPVVTLWFGAEVCRRHLVGGERYEKQKRTRAVAAALPFLQDDAWDEVAEAVGLVDPETKFADDNEDDLEINEVGNNRTRGLSPTISEDDSEDEVSSLLDEERTSVQL